MPCRILLEYSSRTTRRLDGTCFNRQPREGTNGEAARICKFTRHHQGIIPTGITALSGCAAAQGQATPPRRRTVVICWTTRHKGNPPRDSGHHRHGVLRHYPQGPIPPVSRRRAQQVALSAFPLHQSPSLTPPPSSLMHIRTLPLPYPRSPLECESATRMQWRSTRCGSVAVAPQRHRPTAHPSTNQYLPLPHHLRKTKTTRFLRCHRWSRSAPLRLGVD